MEKKTEIDLEEFMAGSWNRLKQLLFAAQAINTKETEDSVAEETYTNQAEEVEDQDDQDEGNDEESEHVEDEVKYTEPEESEEPDASQYDEETKLIIEGITIRSY